MFKSRGHFKNNFMSFKDHELISVQISTLYHFEESRKLKEKLVVLATQWREYFFTSLLGATLWSILTPTTGTTTDTFDFFTLQWCIFQKNYMVVYLLPGGTLLKYNLVYFTFWLIIKWQSFAKNSEIATYLLNFQ